MKKIFLKTLLAIWIFWMLFWWVFAWEWNGKIVNHWWENFDLNTLFVNKHLLEDKKKIHTVEDAISALVKMITWLIWWTAVLWVLLWWFFILTSWWSDDWMTKWKNIIKYSLIWIVVSLVSYSIIQIVQIFLFSFQN